MSAQFGWLSDKIEIRGDKPCIAVDNADYTYQDLADRIKTYRKFILQSGLKPGSVVAILSDYTFPAIGLFFALMSNNNIIIPITSKNTKEIAVFLDESMADYVVECDSQDALVINTVASKEKHDLIQSLQEQGVPGIILFSSGSTGVPKAMIHNLDNLISVYAGRNEKSLNIMAFLMFDHIGGLNTMLNAIAMGALLVIPSSREPDEVCALIDKYKVHLLPTSPTFLNLLLIKNALEDHSLKSLRLISYGTEPMPASLLTRLREAFPRVRFLQTFGTSETGIAQTVSKSSGSLFLKIDDPNQEYKIVDGELWLKSKTRIMGYLNTSMDSFTDDGWFKTGDMVEVSEDGYVKIVGRNKEIINVGGEKVLPTEVESVVMELDSISDCIAYSVPNAITGQSVGVDITVTEGVDFKNAKKEVRKYCTAVLAKFKSTLR